MMNDAFRRVAHRILVLVGGAPAFMAAFLIIIAWAAVGPFLHFSDTWQGVINTSTAILTFLVVFLIQHTQNRNTRAIQLKLDELLRAVEAARTGMVKLEELGDQELDALHKEFQGVAAATEKGEDEVTTQEDHGIQR